MLSYEVVFFLHYGWFLQNVEKDFLPSIMHTTVSNNCIFLGFLNPPLPYVSMFSVLEQKLAFSDLPTHPPTSAYKWFLTMLKPSICSHSKPRTMARMRLLKCLCNQNKTFEKPGIYSLFYFCWCFFDYLLLT